MNISPELIELEKQSKIEFNTYYKALIDLDFKELIHQIKDNQHQIYLYHDDGIVVYIDSFKDSLNEKKIYYNALIDYGTNLDEMFTNFYSTKSDSGTYYPFGDGRSVRSGINNVPFFTIANIFPQIILLKSWVDKKIILKKEMYQKDQNFSGEEQFENFMGKLSLDNQNILKEKIRSEHSVYSNNIQTSIYEESHLLSWNSLIERNHGNLAPSKDSQVFYCKSKDLLLSNIEFNPKEFKSDEGINFFHLLSNIKDSAIFNKMFEYKNNNDFNENLTLLNSYDNKGWTPVLYAIFAYNTKMPNDIKKNIETFLTWAFETYQNKLVLFNDKNSLLNILMTKGAKQDFLYDLIEKNDIKIEIPFHDIENYNTIHAKVIETFDFDVEKLKQSFEKNNLGLSFTHFEEFLARLEKKQIENVLTKTHLKNKKIKL